MADFLLDHRPSAIRAVFLFKVAINAALAGSALLVHDVPPAFVWFGLFGTAALLNLVVAVRMEPTRVVSWAMVISVIGCLGRGAALIVARFNGTLHPVPVGNFISGVTIWVILAGTAVAMTLGPAAHLGPRRVRGE